MARRAIDQFRPQIRSTPQNQGHQRTQSTKLEALEDTADAVPFAEDHDLGPEVQQPGPQPATPSPPSAAPKVEQEQPSEEPPLISPATPLPRQKRLLVKTLARQFRKGARVVGVPLVWVGVIAFCGGTAYSAYSWLTDISPIPNCDRLWLFSRDADKLYCAEQAVQAGGEEALLSGLRLVEHFPSYHYLYKNAAQLKKTWSKQLLQSAQDKARQGDLDGAIQLAQNIAPDNPSYRDAKNDVLEWEKLRDREQQLTTTLEAALKRGDWQAAETVIQPKATGMSEYERHQLNRLTERVISERVAYNQLRQLRSLVNAKAPGDSVTLGRAIQLAMQISPNTYVGDVAQADIQRWSTFLVQIADAQMAKGDLSSAIATAQWLPETANLTPSVRHLLWVHRAQRFEVGPPTKPPTPAQLWQLSTILSSLSQIPSDSPLYSYAQASAKILEKRLQDLTQLSLANTVANTQQIPSLQLAIQMASGISLERPHRLQAQTLIAQWRQDLQRVADQPYLTVAKQLAQSGKIPDLQRAIAQASKIPLGRALRPTAQAAIFDWRQKIQTIEDKPILDKARQLAQQKQLAAAIQHANKIPAGRALYPEAQGAIQAWTRTLQIAEDRPVLDKAKVLASQGDWGTAMDVAYQIAPGRALYNEAQTAIAGWSAQLEASRPARWEYRRDDPAYAENPERDRNRAASEGYAPPARRWSAEPPPPEPQPPELPPP